MMSNQPCHLFELFTNAALGPENLLKHWELKNTIFMTKRVFIVKIRFEEDPFKYNSHF